LKDLVGRHAVGVIAIGNQSACRETEELVAEVIAEGTYFHENPGVTDFPGAPATPSSSAPAPEPSAPEDQAPVEGGPPGAEASAPEPVQERAPVATQDSTPVWEPPERIADEDKPATNGSTIGNPAEVLPPISGGAPESGPSSEIDRSPEVEASSSPEPI